MPKLRFPEFSGEWQVSRLEKLFTEFKSGHNITAAQIQERGKFPVYGGNGLRGYIDKYTHDGYYFLIGRQGALCGNINKSEGKAYFSEHAIACMANEENDTEWLAHRLDYYNLNRLSESSAQPGLSVSKLLRFKLVVPNKQEQQKIASFLLTIDKRIQTQSKIIEHQESLMKGFMKKILAQNLRFKDDDGNEYPEWEEKRLDDIGKFTSGIGFSNSEQGGKEGIPFLKVSDMNLDGNEKEIKVANNYVSTSQITNKKYKPITEYSIIFAKVGAAVFLERKRISRNFLIDNNMMSFTPSGNIQYIKYLFETIRLSKYAQTGALPSYNASDIKNIKIQLPSFKEQTKIANFLSSLDDKLEKEKLVLKQYQQQKKHLLQNLFI